MPARRSEWTHAAPRATALLLLLLGSGCEGGGGSVRADAADADGPPPGGYPFFPGMPPHTTCAVDDDCIVVTNLPHDRCCDSPGGYVSRSRAWLRWVEDQRKQTCAGARCEPLPMPGPEPVGCIREARCLRGACDNACNAADAGGRPAGAPPPPPTAR